MTFTVLICNTITIKLKNIPSTLCALSSWTDGIIRHGGVHGACREDALDGVSAVRADANACGALPADHPAGVEIPNSAADKSARSTARWLI